MPDKFVNYSTLQQLIDKFISKYGTEKTFNIFYQKLQEKNPSFNQDYVIANVVANTAIELFKLTTEQFKSHHKLNYNPITYYAQASCFRLIRRHTKLSRIEIVHFFNGDLTLEEFRYAIRKANELIELPKINQDIHLIMKKHEELVNNTIKIIP